MRVKELIQTLYEFNDEDWVALSACDKNGDETDLYNFYIDCVQDCEDNEGKKFTEVRICQLPHQKID
jgi:hypothetical protein